MFASLDAEENKDISLNNSSSLGERKCCTGGVDFVTMICALLFTYSVFPKTWKA